MGRGPKPARGKAKPAVSRKSRTNEDALVRDLEKRLAEALQREAEALRQLQTSHHERAEAQEQQTATAEILRVISQSPTDIQSVFETVLQRAVRLCAAGYAALFRFDGSLIHLAAAHNLPPDDLESVSREYPMSPTRGKLSGRAILSREVAQVADILADPDYWPTQQALSFGVRSILAVPMVRSGDPIGAILIYRREVGLFPDEQVMLLQTFADQAVIAIENVRLFTELQASNRDLTATLEQQTATGEILRVIATSPTDIQPVFDAVAESAARLTATLDVALFLRDGDGLRLAAHHGPIPVRSTVPLIRAEVTGRAVLDGQTVHVADLQSETVEFPGGSENARRLGLRTILSVPLVREGGIALGTINLRRAEELLFTERQVALLQTFADQAVIAIENVRLFKELQASNGELRTALDTQTATSDILSVISRSQTDVQPVFEAILSSAVRLLGAYSGALSRVVANQIELVAFTRTDDAGAAALRAAFPQSLQSELPHAQAIRDRVPLNIADAQADPRLPEAEHVRARVRGFRSRVLVPLLRHEESIGAISVARREPGGFNADEISLLQTFADQAVIAIENVRLFKELQASNSELRISLEQQTATAEVLRVISRSQTDLQPVFAAILDSAVRLCGADTGGICRIQDGQLVLVAFNPSTPENWAVMRDSYPRPVDTTSLTGRAVVEARVIHVPDVERSDALPVLTSVAKGIGFRSHLSMPILRGGEPIGVLALQRRVPGPFTEAQIELVQTFADQAVIAIENARLLAELQARTAALTRSVEQLTALSEVSRAVSSTLDIEAVLDTIVSRASELAGDAGCSIYEYDEGTERFELRAAHHYDREFVEALRASPLRRGEGLMGRAAETHEPAQIPDISRPGAYDSSVRDTLVRFGYRALLSVPLLREEQIIGSLSFNRKTPGEFSPEVVDVLKTFATQSALAIQNARLFREIEDKSRELEVVSQHKSEFLANMSHELRTPLNAIIGFSEVLSEKMFGELNEKQEEYLKDIYASGTHLLSLINDILDLSKIEAGRMELELSDFHLPTALDSALTLVRERAGRRSIALQINVDERLGQIQADERKVRQIVLNLLSNAIKFTPEGGRIEVGAMPKDGFVEVSVRDTGVGIAPEDQEAVFEEFRQVGTADKKVEGTGLGLTLCRKFVELHGGRIWLKSELEKGSTFTFTIPVRHGE